MTEREESRIFKKNYLFIYFWAALGLCCCARELLFVAVCRLLVAVASLVEHGL